MVVFEGDFFDGVIVEGIVGFFMEFDFWGVVVVLVVVVFIGVVFGFLFGLCFVLVEFNCLCFLGEFLGFFFVGWVFICFLMFGFVGDFVGWVVFIFLMKELLIGLIWLLFLLIKCVFFRWGFLFVIFFFFVIWFVFIFEK